MKKSFATIAALGVMSYVGVAVASSPSPSVEESVENAAVKIENSLDKMQQSFSGLVKQTDKGLILETADGIYQLKGLSLDEIIGKQVYVTGVVKTEDKAETIYVVKADVKE